MSSVRISLFIHTIQVGRRILFFFIAILFLNSALMYAYIGQPYSEFPVNGIIGLAVVVLASWIMTHFVDQRPIGSLGLSFHTSHLLIIVFGFIIGIIVKTIALYTIIYLQTSMIPVWPIYMVSEPDWTGFAQLLSSLVDAAVEELFYRGYVLQVLIQTAGNLSGLIASSIIFGIFHLGFGWQYGISAVILGISLGTLVMRSGSIWLAVACHWGINLVGNEIILKTSQVSPEYDPLILSLNNPQYWPIFSIITVILIFMPLPVDRKGRVLWERYVQRPAWPPWHNNDN